MTREETLCFIVQNGKVLLGEKQKDKKRMGKTKGFFNGFGGKVELGEMPQETIIREGKEEFDITVINPHRRGSVSFTFYLPDSDQQMTVLVYLFTATEYEGELKASEEMIPRWFTLSEIPFDRMEKNDKIWIPRLLSTPDEQLQAKFSFSKEGEIEKQELSWKEEVHNYSEK